MVGLLMVAHIPTLLLGCIVSIAYTSVSISYTRVPSHLLWELSVKFTLFHFPTVGSGL